MKKKRFQWLSNLRKFVRNNLCWRIRKKNERKQEIDDIEIKSLPEASLYSQQISVPLSPQPYISQSATVTSEFRESLYKEFFSLENDDSLLILLTKRNDRQLSFPGVSLETLPVIPLPWVKKLSDIREGSILEFQMELPMSARYVGLERSWMTFWGSYPSLLSKMQIVPYERQRSSWYLELASGEPQGQNAPFSTARSETSVSTDDITVGDMEIKDSRTFTKNAKSGETSADLPPLPVIPLPWVKKFSDIREGSILEFQMELPMSARYVDLERSWMTSRILECFRGSYPSLLSKMQIVPYERQRSSWYLELASGEPQGQKAPFSTARSETSVSTDDIPVGDMEIKDSRIFTNNAKSGETFDDIPPLSVIPLPWVKKFSDIREGSILEFQMELPMSARYVDLERSGMTFWGSYPSLLSKMKIVPYERQRSSWYLELASGEPQGQNAPFSTARSETSVSTDDIPVGDMEIKDSRTFTKNAKSGETFADLPPLPVIPLPWVKKLSDFREGSILEFQMEIPMATRYVDLERSWMTSRILQCFRGSYPSLLSKMQIVPYERQRSSWYLELASGEPQGQNAPFSTARSETSVSTDDIPVGDMEIKDSRIFTNNAISGETFADIPPLPVIPLPWVKKLSDIREGSILEFQMELPMSTRYVDLERSWMTFWGSYPSLLSKVQIVPYERQRSSWYLELASGEPHSQNTPFSTARRETSVSTDNIPVRDMEIKDSRIFTNNAKSGETFADITPLHKIRAPFGPDHLKSRLPSTDTLEVNWSVNDVNIKAIHLTSLLAEDGDYKKLYKGHNGDIKFVVTVYRRVPKKLDMNDLARLKSPYLAELYGIFQYNSHRWITYVEAKYGDLHSLLRQDLQRTVFGEYEAKFVVVRLLSALAYLHRQGVVHGDIRPRKIFINNLGMPPAGTEHVMGLMEPWGRGGLETVTWPSNKALVMKSPNSMKIGFVAPEVVTGFRPQAESDIFSVGCVAYFIATGSRPFSKRNELLNMKVRPKLTDTKLSLGALEFISACLQKPMRKRFHLGIGLRYVYQTDWFADMDVYEVSPRSPLIKAIEQINKDVTFTHEEKGLHV